MSTDKRLLEQIEKALAADGRIENAHQTIENAGRSISEQEPVARKARAEIERLAPPGGVRLVVTSKYPRGTYLVETDADGTGFRATLVEVIDLP